MRRTTATSVPAAGLGPLPTLGTRSDPPFTRRATTPALPRYCAAQTALLSGRCLFAVRLRSVTPDNPRQPGQNCNRSAIRGKEPQAPTGCPLPPVGEVKSSAGLEIGPRLQLSIEFGFLYTPPTAGNVNRRSGQIDGVAGDSPHAGRL